MTSKKIYKFAKEYLLSMKPNEISELALSEYFDIEKKFKTKNDIMKELATTLQDFQMLPKVIALNSKGRIDTFKKILFNFDSAQILDNYDDKKLFETFKNNFNIKNIESKNNLWKRYAKSILSASFFINSFRSAEEFDRFINQFSLNQYTKQALPMLLEKEIYGMGFALACNFLKDLGYTYYPKPDIHLIQIFKDLGLSDGSVLGTYKAIIKFADECEDTPFNVDRTFWLICSGYFFMHEKKVPGKKKDFLNSIKEKF